MTEALFIFAVALIVAHTDLLLTKHNMNVEWNGLGVMARVVWGTAMVPQQYRIFVPWVCTLLCRDFQSQRFVNTYLSVKEAGVVFAVSMAFFYFRSLGLDPFLPTVMLGLWFILAAFFDYPETYYEFGFFALAFWLMGMDIPWMIFPLFGVTLLAALNRETAVFIPFVMLLAGCWLIAGILGVAFLLGYGIPRLRQKSNGRYCPFFHFGINWERLKKDLGPTFHRGAYIHFFLLLALAGWAWIGGAFAGTLTPVDMAMALFLVLMLVPVCWYEIRAFSPVMLSLIPIAVRAL